MTGKDCWSVIYQSIDMPQSMCLKELEGGNICKLHFQICQSNKGFKNKPSSEGLLHDHTLLSRASQPALSINKLTHILVINIDISSQKQKARIPKTYFSINTRLHFWTRPFFYMNWSNSIAHPTVRYLKQEDENGISDKYQEMPFPGKDRCLSRNLLWINIRKSQNMNALRIW